MDALCVYNIKMTKKHNELQVPEIIDHAIDIPLSFAHLLPSAKASSSFRDLFYTAHRHVLCESRSIRQVYKVIKGTL